jgi:hypothetical protein
VRLGAAAGVRADQGLQIQLLVYQASELTYGVVEIKLAVEGQPLGGLGIPGRRGKERGSMLARRGRDVQ